MGTLFCCLGGATIMFRTFAIACLAAVAFAEPQPKPDAALLYGAYGYGIGLGYGHGAGHYGYGLNGLGYTHYYGKREADAEPEAEAEADPALLYSSYGYGLGHYGYAGLGYHGYTALGPYGYAGLGHYGYAGLGHLGSLTTMESVRLRLTLPFSIALMAMVLDIMDMLVWDILAMVPTMASARLKQLTNTTSSSNNLNQTPIQSVICSSASF